MAGRSCGSLDLLFRSAGLAMAPAAVRAHCSLCTLDRAVDRWLASSALVGVGAPGMVRGCCGAPGAESGPDPQRRIAPRRADGHGRWPGCRSDRCLEAMDDSRVGASGVLVLVLVVLIELAALVQLGHKPLSRSAWRVSSRVAPLWAMALFLTCDPMAQQHFIDNMPVRVGMRCPHSWPCCCWPL